MKQAIRSESYELLIEKRISWKSKRKIIVNRRTKPPLNVHSHCNLVRTNPNSSGVHATESSPYIVKNAKILHCQGREAKTAGSSFGRGQLEAVMPSPMGGPLSEALGLHTVALSMSGSLEADARNKRNKFN